MGNMPKSSVNIYIKKTTTDEHLERHKIKIGDEEGKGTVLRRGEPDCREIFVGEKKDDKRDKFLLRQLLSSHAHSSKPCGFQRSH